MVPAYPNGWIGIEDRAICRQGRAPRAADGCACWASPQSIAAAVNSLAADSEGRARMHENGLRLSRDRYDCALESAPLLQLYRSLARGSAPGLTRTGAAVE